MVRRPPYPTVLKPYGRALVELARARTEIVCLSADLTRQCEVDLFREAIPDRFINVGMAEQNLMGIAGGLARQGHIPFVHSFGVFCSRRAYDQVAMAIAYPCLPVRRVGFMPGLSSPGGPGHQAIDDLALMRALPNLTVLDLADATETRQAVEATVAGVGARVKGMGVAENHSIVGGLGSAVARPWPRPGACPFCSSATGSRRDGSWPWPGPCWGYRGGRRSSRRCPRPPGSTHRCEPMRRLVPCPPRPAT
ncbi:MAG TPA: hypothetical protein VFD01_10955 [Candidatus Dormibacteraeota bacterium]|nr:hypothetical protein [Candidatus Dormibacteraeota bacterium]